MSRPDLSTDDATAGASLPCRPPLVDASMRGMAPLGIAMLVAFALVWSALAATFVADAWRGYVAPGIAAGEADGASPAPQVAGTSLPELCIAAGLFLAGPAMLLSAHRYRRRLHEDGQRRERLRTRGRRVPAAAVRIVEEIAGGRRTRRVEYRALVTFDAPDGRRYEAASDRFPGPRPPRVALDGLAVLCDEADPLDSLVDEASPAMRSARRSVPYHST